MCMINIPESSLAIRVSTIFSRAFNPSLSAIIFYLFSRPYFDFIRLQTRIKSTSLDYLVDKIGDRHKFRVGEIFENDRDTTQRNSSRFEL